MSQSRFDKAVAIFDSPIDCEGWRKPPELSTSASLMNRMAEPAQKKIKPTLPAWQYDAVQGGVHAALLTTASSIGFYPFDQQNIRKTISIHTSKKVPAGFTWGMSIKGLAEIYGKNNPWAGVLHDYRISLPRNMVVFTLLPELNDKFKEWGMSPVLARSASGTVAGVVEAFWMRKYEVVRIARATQAQVPLCKVNLQKAQRDAFLFRSARSIGFYAIMPPAAEYIQKQLQNFHLPASNLEKDGDAAIAGAVAGLLPLGITYPIEVAKNRKIHAPNSDVIKPALDALKKEGVRALLSEHMYPGLTAVAGRMSFYSGVWQVARQVSETMTGNAFDKDEVPVVSRKPK